MKNKIISYYLIILTLTFIIFLSAINGVRSWIFGVVALTYVLALVVSIKTMIKEHNIPVKIQIKFVIANFLSLFVLLFILYKLDLQHFIYAFITLTFAFITNFAYLILIELFNKDDV